MSDTSAKLEPGTAVTASIRLVRPLAEGAMGAVWVAHHETLETDVAVKFILRELKHDHADLAQRFADEARAAAQIKSPHVIQVFDHGTMADGTPYMVMELLNGESLAERLARTGWLSFEQTNEVVRQTCKALQRAHALDIVHRDIKPDNIFLCSSDEGLYAKVLDFGVAKTKRTAPRKATQPGTMVGTAEYMSREQVQRAYDIDHRADLWAMAVVAYEMLTGDCPFVGETLGMVCVAICQGQFVPPSQLRKGVPASVDAWFARAFHDDPDRRFADAKELAVTFSAALFGEDGTEDELSSARIMSPAMRTQVGLASDPIVAAALPRAGASDHPPAHHERDDLESLTDTPVEMPVLPVRKRWSVGWALAIAACLAVAWIALGASAREQALVAQSHAARSIPIPSLLVEAPPNELHEVRETGAEDQPTRADEVEEANDAAQATPAEPPAQRRRPAADAPPVASADPAPPPAPAATPSRSDYGF